MVCSRATKRFPGVIRLRTALVGFICVVFVGCVLGFWTVAQVRTVEHMEDVGADELQGIVTNVRVSVSAYFETVSSLVGTAKLVFSRAYAKSPDNPFLELQSYQHFFVGMQYGIKGFGGILFFAQKPPQFMNRSACDAEVFGWSRFSRIFRTRYDGDEMQRMLHTATDPSPVGYQDVDCKQLGSTSFLFPYTGIPGTPENPGVTEPHWTPVTSTTGLLFLKMVPFEVPEVNGIGALSVELATNFDEAAGTNEDGYFKTLLSEVAAASHFDATVAVFSSAGELYASTDPLQEVVIRTRDTLIGITLANNASMVREPVLGVAALLIDKYCKRGRFTRHECVWTAESFVHDGYLVAVESVSDRHAKDLNFLAVAMVKASEVRGDVEGLRLTLFLYAAVPGVALLLLALLMSRSITTTIERLHAETAAVSGMNDLEGVMKATGGLSWVKEFYELYETLHSVAFSLICYQQFLPKALEEEESHEGGSISTHNPLVRISEPAPPRGEAAVVFTEIPAFPVICEKSPKLMRRALIAYNAVIRDTVSIYRGYEVKTIGENFMIVFPDFAKAVRCALAIQEKLHQMVWPSELTTISACKTEPGWNGLRIRVGIHFGQLDSEINEVTRRADYFGTTVNKASRLCSAAQVGTIAVDGDIWEEFDQKEDLAWLRPYEIDTGRVVLKGIRDPCSMRMLIPRCLPERFEAVRNRRGTGGMAISTPHVLVQAPPTTPRMRHASVVSCTVGHIKIFKAVNVRFSFVKHDLEVITSCVNRSCGVIHYLIGSCVGVYWSSSSRSQSHFSRGVNFTGLAHDQLKASIGLASGTAVFGHVSATSSRFVALIGLVVNLAVALEAAAESIGAFALTSSMPGMHAVSHDKALVGLVRPVDIWPLPLQPEEVVVVYEIRSKSLKHRYAWGGSDGDWGWSQAYATAFFTKAYTTIQGMSTCFTLQKVARCLREETHLHPYIPPGYVCSEHMSDNASTGMLHGVSQSTPTSRNTHESLTH
ncbi:Adenylate cyclase [Diplonema papillatum]|nr:Adenylate cyclase [Diplonema papillatum]